MTGLLSWALVGFLGQGVFTARFLVQWIASEREGDSVVPVAFWWLSLVGGSLLLAYAIYRGDPVFILGQVAGPVVFSRNLVLIARNKKRRASALKGVEAGPGRGPHLGRSGAARSASGVEV